MKVGNSYKKKVEWVFVFSTPFDLQKFAKIIDEVTQPNKNMEDKNAPEKQLVDQGLEARRKLYMEDNDIRIAKQAKRVDVVKKLDKRYDISDLVNDN